MVSVKKYVSYHKDIKTGDGSLKTGDLKKRYTAEELAEQARLKKLLGE